MRFFACFPDARSAKLRALFGFLGAAREVPGAKKNPFRQKGHARASLFFSVFPRPRFYIDLWSNSGRLSGLPTLTIVWFLPCMMHFRTSWEKRRNWYRKGSQNGPNIHQRRPKTTPNRKRRQMPTVIYFCLSPSAPAAVTFARSSCFLTFLGVPWAPREILKPFWGPKWTPKSSNKRVKSTFGPRGRPRRVQGGS